MEDACRNGGWCLVESDDGQYLYYSKSDVSGIWRVPLAGGVEEEIVSEPVHWEGWSLRGQHLYYVTGLQNLDPLQSTIKRLDVVTGQATTLFVKEGTQFLSMTVSPDEKWILFGEPPPTESELMLVENFR